MGNKTEEVQIEKELDELDEKEIKINLELYKLQTEVNKRKSKDQQIKLKKNYANIIDKWKRTNLPEKVEDIINKYDPYEEAIFDKVEKEQKILNKKNEQENKDKNKINKNKINKNKSKNKETILDSGIPKLKKRMKELENMEEENEIYEVRKNKDKIKSDYIKDLNEIEQDIFEENVREDMVKDINKNLDIPDINEDLLIDKLSDLYNNKEDNNEYSVHEENYSNDYELYKKIVKDNELDDKLYDIKFKCHKPGEENKKIEDKNDKKWKKGYLYGINFEYEAKKNEIIDKAIERRNHIVKNGNILKDDNSPYSDYQPSENKSDNISQYY